MTTGVSALRTVSPPLAFPLGVEEGASFTPRRASAGDLFFLGGLPLRRFTAGGVTASGASSPFSGLLPPVAPNSTWRRAIWGCWGGVGSVDGGAASQGPLVGGEDSGPNVLRGDGLPTQAPDSDAPAAWLLAAPRCCRRRRTSSFSSTTVTRRPGSFRSTLGPGGCPGRPTPWPRISTSALVRRRGGRAGEGPSGEEVAEDEVDGTVTSTETNSGGFLGLETGVWVSTRSSSFLTCSGGSSGGSSDAAVGGGSRPLLSLRTVGSSSLLGSTSGVVPLAGGPPGTSCS